MKTENFNTPILLLIFNRPDYVARQIENLRRIKPKYLFVSADGPRPDHQSDLINCKLTRSMIKQIDWECQVKTNYNEKNLGCKIGVSTGIDWFFNQVEMGIILEDDCLAEPTFFEYCEQLLEKYKDSDSVALIAGSNPLVNFKIKDSYLFSVHPLCWGWASWRRAWQNYDLKMKSWPTDGTKIINLQFNSKSARSFWQKIFTSTYLGQIDTWDYQWIYTIWKNKQLCIIPKSNLVSNIGFDNRATHTKLAFSPLAGQKTSKIAFPLKHPVSTTVNQEFDDRLQKSMFEKNNYLKLLSGILKYFNQKMGLQMVE